MILIGTPHSKGAGYFMNDDTASGGVKTEADIRTCMHCQAVLKMQEWKEDGGFCGRCMAPVCTACADAMITEGCIPFMKRIEEEFDMVMKLKAFLKEAGLEPVNPASKLFTGLIK